MGMKYDWKWIKRERPEGRGFKSPRAHHILKEKKGSLKDKESYPSTILPLTLWTNGFSFSKTVYASLHGVEDSVIFITTEASPFRAKRRSD